MKPDSAVLVPPPPPRSGAGRVAWPRLDLSAAHTGQFLAWGLLAGVLLTVVLATQQLMLGRSPFGEPGEWNDVWVAALHCLLGAYLPAAYLAILVSARHAEKELPEPSGPGSSRGARSLPPFGRPAPVWLLAGGLGMMLAFLGPWLTEPGVGPPLHFWQPDLWPVEVYWHRVGGLWIGPWFGWFAVALLHESRRFSAIARRMPDFDPFDTRSFRPFLRLGLGNALAAAGLATLVGLLGLDQGLTLMLLSFGGVAVVLMAVAGLLPLLGVRRRIGAAKAAELEWCEAAVAAERVRVRAGEPASRPNRLADLLAYRTLVEGINVWGVDLPALQRFVLYLLIPVLSWIVSAVVQDIVQQAMRAG